MVPDMFNHLSPVYKGILLALLGYSAFSCSDAAAKLLAGYYPIYEVLAIENGIACLILLAFSPWLGGVSGIFDKTNLKVNGIRAVLNFFVGILVIYSFRELPMATAYTMFFTIPFFAALFAIQIYKEKLTRNRALAIAVGFAGVMIATRPGSESFNVHTLVPLGTAILIMVLFVCTKSLKNPTPFMLAFVPMAGGCIIALPFTVIDFIMPTVEHLVVFTILAAFSAAGFVMVSKAYNIAAAAVVAPFMYIQMLWGLGLGYVMFNDVADIWMLAGAGIITISGIYLVETERRIPQQEPRIIP